jgi:hypothetical protein
MKKKVCAVAMFLMLALFFGYSFAHDDDNQYAYSLSFQGSGQDCCGLTDIDDLSNPTEASCDTECDDGCGSSYTYYDLKFTIIGNRAFGKLRWESCWYDTDDGDDGELVCNPADKSRLEDGRLLRDRKFQNTYLTFAVSYEGLTDTSGCPAAVYRDYFMLLVKKDDSGNITGLEGGATSFEDEDCAGWSAAEIIRVDLNRK